MSETYTADKLNTMSVSELSQIILSQQEQIMKLNENFERLVEQLRIANQQRFGRHSEKLDVIDGQLNLFDEAEAFCDPDAAEPEIEEVIVQSHKRKKHKGKREEDLAGFPVEPHPHDVSKEDLDAFFGEGNWKEITPDVYKRLRYEPASWTVEEHTVHVYVGTDGEHQDEFLRGDRPKDLIRNSIVTESLGAAILNGKFVNALPLNRISQEFDRNGLTLSRQTMSNWVLKFSEYFAPVWDRLKYHLLELPVIQSDETPTIVIHDGRPPGSSAKSWMWVHRSGEFFKDRQIILYEYQKTRHHDHARRFYGDFQGTLVTDGLQQYYLVEKETEGSITNANCWAHARRDLADACKAMDSKDPKAMKQSTAHKALELIAAIYNKEEALKPLSAQERLERRQTDVAPLVEAFFAWVKETTSSTKILPKGKTAEGLQYCLNHEDRLKVFLHDGNVPIDNSASERAIRPFCIGKKNWVLINTIKGAQASAICYSIAETAKANNLKPYMYFKHLLSELKERADKDGKVDPATLDDLMPWAESLPEECRKSR